MAAAVVVAFVIIGMIVSTDTEGFSNGRRATAAVSDPFLDGLVQKALQSFCKDGTTGCLRSPGASSTSMAAMQGRAILRSQLRDSWRNTQADGHTSGPPPSLFLAVKQQASSTSNSDIVNGVVKLFKGISSKHLDIHVLDATEIYRTAHRSAAIQKSRDEEDEFTQQILQARAENAWNMAGREAIHDEIKRMIEATRRQSGDDAVPIVVVPMLGTPAAYSEGTGALQQHQYAPHFRHLQAFQELADDYNAPMRNVLYVFVVDASGINSFDRRELTQLATRYLSHVSNGQALAEVEPLADRVCRNPLVLIM